MTPDQSALYDSYTLGMLYDRSEACPLIGADSLSAYHEITGSRTVLALSTETRPSPSLKIEDDCYWVLRPERKTWVTEVSQLTLQLERIIGGTLYFMQGTERNNITQSII